MDIVSLVSKLWVVEVGPKAVFLPILELTFVYAFWVCQFAYFYKNSYLFLWIDHFNRKNLHKRVRKLCYPISLFLTFSYHFSKFHQRYKFVKEGVMLLFRRIRYLWNLPHIPGILTQRSLFSIMLCYRSCLLCNMSHLSEHKNRVLRLCLPQTCQQSKLHWTCTFFQSQSVS